MKVLVIDDEKDVRYIAGLSLGRIGGMEVIEAASGLEGVRVARAEAPDCILLDVMMPDMDGVATLAALRDDPATASIPVIFVTASVMREDLSNFAKLGALGVVRKPFDPRTLAATIRELLQR